MAKRSYPLELILRQHGTAELVNAHDETLWASDADEDFKEEFNDEFLQENDIDDILDYLFNADIISDDELDNFEGDKWEINMESMDDEDPLDEGTASGVYKTLNGKKGTKGDDEEDEDDEDEE